MPRPKKTENGTPLLVALLAEMFATSQEQGAGIHRQLKSGLHVKVAQRGEKRQVILWREGERLPGRKECEIVARDAGFQNPKYRTWKCKESDDAFLLTEEPLEIAGESAPVVTPLFCPGKPLPQGRVTLPLHTLYGVAVAGDWVTVQRQEDGNYCWRQIRGPAYGRGTRGDFDDFLSGLKDGAA